MAEQFSLKLSAKLAIFEKNSKEWEWSDLINWLSGLKQLLDKNQYPIANDLFHLLSKRLSQCLNPSLPHGLHSKTLEIYALLSSASPIPQLSLLSTGIFPHFQFCAPQNKLQFLKLIESSYLKQAPENNFLFKGIIACLLSGATDTPDAFNKVSEILDSCVSNHKALTYEALWWFIMKSQRHRLAGLMYMQKKSDEDTHQGKIVCALLEAIRDPSVIIKRSALDFIRNNYPLKKQPTEYVITLVQGVLKLFKGKDHTVLRRIWEWIIPIEIDNKQIELISDIIYTALFKIFEENHAEIQSGKNTDEAKLMSVVIIENLCENEYIGQCILEKIAVDLIKHTCYDGLDVIKGQKDTRIKAVFASADCRVFWRAYSRSLDELLDDDESEAFMILQYAKDNLDFAVDSFLSIFTSIFRRLATLKNLLQGLQLLNLIVDFVDLYELEVAPAILFFKSLLTTGDLPILSAMSELFGKLMQKNIEMSEIVDILEAYNKLDCFHSIVLSVKLNIGLNSGFLTELWKLLLIDSQEICLLVTDAFKSNREVWSSVLGSLLLLSDVETQEIVMRKFITYWQYMMINKPIDLDIISRKTNVVLIMIDQLESENPAKRHMAKEWLNLAVMSVHNLVDPVLKVVLHKSTVRELNSDGFYMYQFSFDSAKVEKAIQKLILIIKNSTKNINYFMHQSVISDYCKLKCDKHAIPSMSYLSLLIKLMLMFIQTPFVNENLQYAACEMLMLLSQSLPQELITQCLSLCSDILYKLVDTDLKDTIYMLKILEVLFDSNEVPVTYPSRFTDSLIIGLINNETKLRHTWMKFTTHVMPYILSSIPVSELIKLLQALFLSYFDIITRHHDFVMIAGLSDLIELSLNINNKKQLALNHSEVNRMIKKEINKILIIALEYYKENPEDNGMLNLLIIPIKNTFQNSLINAMLKIWKQLSADRNKNNELVLFAKNIPSFDIGVEEILDVLIKKLQKRSENEEIIIGTFTISVLKHLRLFKIPFVHANLWAKITMILKLISTSSRKESLAIQINIAYLITTQLPKHASVIKDLQSLIRGGFTSSASDLLKSTEPALELCYFNTETYSGSVTSLIFLSLVDRGPFVFDIIWSEKQEKERNLFVSTVLNDLITKCVECTERGELISELIYNLFKNCCETIAENVKRNLTEFIKWNLMGFLQRFPTSFRVWGLIVGRLAVYYYKEKSEVLSDFMYHLEPGVFSNIFGNKITLNNYLFNSSALMSFLIFTSPKNTYIKALQGITEKLERLLKNEISLDLLTVLLVLIKVLYLRITRKYFNKIFSSIWPDVLAIISECIRQKNPSLSFEILKFLDFALAVGFSYNFMICLLLIDVPAFDIVNSPTDNFQPVIASIFFQGYSAVVCKYEGKETKVPENREKSLLLSGRINNEEELEFYARRLLQHSSFYSSELFKTNWDSVEKGLESELVALGTRSI